MKPTSAGGYQTVLFKEKTGGDNYSLYAVNGTGTAPAAYANFPSGSTDTLAQGPTQLPLNAWSQLTATYDGSALSLYVNGSLVSTQAANGSISCSNRCSVAVFCCLIHIRVERTAGRRWAY